MSDAAITHNKRKMRKYSRVCCEITSCACQLTLRACLMNPVHDLQSQPCRSSPTQNQPVLLTIAINFTFLTVEGILFTSFFKKIENCVRYVTHIHFLPTFHFLRPSTCSSHLPRDFLLCDASHRPKENVISREIEKRFFVTSDKREANIRKIHARPPSRFYCGPPCTRSKDTMDMGKEQFQAIPRDGLHK